MAISTSKAGNGSRRWPWVLGLLLLAVIGAVSLLPSLINPNIYRQELAKLISDGLGGEVELGPLSWGLGADIWLQAESISLKDAVLLPVDIDAGPVYLRLALAPLLQRSLVFEQISIAEPRFRIRLQSPVKPAPGSVDVEGSAAIPDIRIRSLRITGGQLLLQDERKGQSVLPGDIHLSELALELTQLETDGDLGFELAVGLDSTAGDNWGRLKGKGSLRGLGPGFAVEQAKLDFHAELSELAAEAQHVLLPAQYRQDELGGSLSANVDYQGDLGGQGQINGDIDLGRLSYRDPALWSVPLNVAASRLQFQLEFAPQQFQLQQLELSWGELAVTARGIVDDWSSEPVLRQVALQAQLPLEGIIPLVPWAGLGEDKAILRDLLAGGGAVHLENFELPDLELTRLPEDKAELLRGVTAAATLSGLSVEPAPQLPRIEHISGQLQLRDGVLRGQDISARIGPLNLPTITLLASELLDTPRLDVTAKGPLYLAADSSDKVEALLSSNGLKSISGSADVDIKVHYDQAHPGHWGAGGWIQLQQMQLHTLSSNAALEMHGKLLLRRKNNLDVLLDGLGGLVNGAPFKLDGKILDIGSDQLLADLQLQTSDLELAPLTELIPALEASQLKGKLDADLSIFLVANKPKKTHLKGTLATRDLGLYLADNNIRLEQLNSELLLSANRVNIVQMEGRVNAQALALDGYLMLLPDISGKLQLSSTELDLDQLLPQSDTASSSPATTGAAEPTAGTQLPPALRSAALKLSARIDKGQYRKVPFRDLSLELDYGAGQVRKHSFTVNFERGAIHTRGQADLNDLEHVPFDIHYQVDTIQLENILPLLNVEPPTVSGPLSTSGHIMGRTGGTGELQRSLRGELSLAAGPGRIPKVGNFGKGLFTILGVINVEGLIKGQMTSGLAIEGVPYDSLELGSTFIKEGMRLDHFAMITPAISTRGSGLVDLAGETMRMDMTITVLGTLDKVLGMVPLVGSAAASVTKAYLEVEGPMAKPEVRVRQVKGMYKELEKESKDSGWKTSRGLERLKGKLTPAP